MLKVESYIAPFRGDELPVRNQRAAWPGHLADQHAEPEADGEQVEQRLEDAGHEDDPGVLVHPGVPFDQPQPAGLGARPAQPGQQPDRRGNPEC
jgi:hypothetical protein